MKHTKLHRHLVTDESTDVTIRRHLRCIADAHVERRQHKVEREPHNVHLPARSHHTINNASAPCQRDRCKSCSRSAARPRACPLPQRLTWRISPAPTAQQTSLRAHSVTRAHTHARARARTCARAKANTVHQLCRRAHNRHSNVDDDNRVALQLLLCGHLEQSALRVDAR
jgi:hypothetical protein